MEVWRKGGDGSTLPGSVENQPTQSGSATETTRGTHVLNTPSHTHRGHSTCLLLPSPPQALPQGCPEEKKKLRRTQPQPLPRAHSSSSDQRFIASITYATYCLTHGLVSQHRPRSWAAQPPHRPRGSATHHQLFPCHPAPPPLSSPGLRLSTTRGSPPPW